MALGCGSILIGVTVDYGIYVLYHIDDAPPSTREQLARAVAQLTPAVAFGALTTMAAFMVMFVSPVSGHRQLGLFGVVGVALAAMFALLILPVFIPVGATGAARALPLNLMDAAIGRLACPANGPGFGSAPGIFCVEPGGSAAIALRWRLRPAQWRVTGSAA